MARLCVLALWGGVGCVGIPDPVRPAVDSGPPVRSCSPACNAGSRCVDGACVSNEPDVDGDNIASSVDCDDFDATVGRMAERDCMSACGPGVERCAEGTWAPCNAPSVCDCRGTEPPRMVECGQCGQQRQVCVDGGWTSEGMCEGRGECAPGDMRVGGPCGMCGMEVQLCDETCAWSDPACEGTGGDCAPSQTETESQPCPGCGGGTQRRERRCTDDCGWDEWGPWGPCEGAMPMGECMAGETQMETRTCTTECGGGMQTRTRTCSAGCMWDPWSDWGACSGAMGECMPGATRQCMDGRMSPCTEQVCSATCEWGPCGLKVGAECDHVADDGRPGARWRCCMPEMTFWQFCLNTCEWSSDCEACTLCDRCTMAM